MIYEREGKTAPMKRQQRNNKRKCEEAADVEEPVPPANKSAMGNSNLLKLSMPTVAPSLKRSLSSSQKLSVHFSCDLMSKPRNIPLSVHDEVDRDRPVALDKSKAVRIDNGLPTVGNIEGNHSFSDITDLIRDNMKILQHGENGLPIPNNSIHRQQSSFTRAADFIAQNVEPKRAKVM